MTCPPQIASILLEILADGIIYIRVLHKDERYCFVEADHLHNLPGLIRDYTPEKLLWYWDAERPGYIERRSEEELVRMSESWARLRPFVEAERERVVG